MQHDMLARRVQEIAPEVIQWRHQIHQNPELSFHETATSALIEQKLRSFGIDEIRRIGASGTGVFATLRGTGKGPDLCLGIRADIDALPIQEQSGVPFASKNPGVFHGCGHDTHTAALLGTAWLLSEFRDQFAGTVKFFFQHAEEEVAGAKEFIAAGVMENPHVDAVLALHALPDIYLGEIGVRDDFMTAGEDNLKITIEGKQGHGGYPHFGVDTILIASTIVTTLQSLGSRELAPTDCALVTFGRIEGGIANSYIGGPVVLTGCIRYLRKETQEKFHRRVREIAEGVAASLRGKATVEITPEAYPTAVSKDWVNRVRRVRMAIEYAINKEAYIHVVYQDKAVQPSGPVVPSSTYTPGQPKVYPCDPARAKALLKEAGYPDGLTLNLWVSSSQHEINGATVIQSMLANVGIKVNISVMESGVFDDKVRSNDQDLIISTWGMQTNRDAGQFWLSLFHSSSIGTTNWTALNDKIVDEGIDLANSSVDPAVRKAAFDKVWERLDEVHPFVCLAVPNELYGGRRDLQGMEDFCDGRLNYLGNLTVEK